METSRSKQKGGKLIPLRRKGLPPDAERTVRFAYGRIEISHAAMEVVSPEDAGEGVLRHLCGDWGDVGMEQWKSNNEALREGRRLHSSYADRKGTRFSVVTEQDRSLTRVLLPEEK